MIKMIILINLALLIQIIESNVQPILLRNPYMSTSSNEVVWETITNRSMALISQSFISAHPNTIYQISNIYYTTSQIDYKLSRQYDNQVGIINFIFQIQAVNFNKAYVQTAITGYLNSNYFISLKYSYILIYNNNPLINTYLKFQEFTYNNTQQTQAFHLPTNVVMPIFNVKYVIFLKQINITFDKLTLKNQDYQQLYLKLDEGLYYYSGNMSMMVQYIITLQNSTFQYGNFSISVLVVSFDQKNLLVDYPQFKFASLKYRITQTSSNKYISATLAHNISDKRSNYLFGIVGYYYDNGRQKSFSFKNTIFPDINKFEAQFYGRFDLNPRTKYQPDHYFAAAYVVFAYYGCDGINYLFNNSSKLCEVQTLCNPGYYFNSTSQICLLCYSYSNNCTETILLSCQTNRYLQDNQCLPNDGFYESNTTVPSSCSLVCRTCQGSASNCTSCADNELLMNNSCVPCSDYAQQCRVCFSNSCASCNLDFFLINQTYCSPQCTDIRCLSCDHTNNSLCLECRDPSDNLIDGKCFSIEQVPIANSNCGNLLIDIGEECDDGNNINRDGCNAYCISQQDYNCSLYTDQDGNNKTDYCAYLHEIDFQVVSIEKLDFSNSVRIIVSVQQYQEAFWDTQTYLNMAVIQEPIPYKNMKVQFVKRGNSHSNVKAVSSVNEPYPANSLLYISFEYLQSIHNQNINLTFAFENSPDERVKQIPQKTVTLSVVPDNNHYAHLYPSELYEYQTNMTSLFSFLSMLALIMFAITLIFGGKRISVEVLVVIHIALFSLVTVPKITPLFSTLTSLYPSVNGINLFYSKEITPFHDSDTNSRIKGTLLYSQFLYNVNVGLVFVFLPLLLGLILFLVSKIINFSQVNAIRIQTVYQRLLTEYPFAGLLFVGCAVGASAVIHMHFGMLKSSAMGLAIMSLVLFAFVLFGVLRYKCPQLFGQFDEMLIKDSSFSLFFHIAYFYFGLFASVLYFQFYSFAYIGFAVCFFALFLYVLTLMKPVFRKNIDKYRTQLNLLTLAMLQVPGMYMNIKTGYQYQNTSQMSLMLPLLSTFLIYLCALINYGMIIYEILKRILLCCQKQSFQAQAQRYEIQQEAQLKQSEIQYQKAIYNQSLKNPLQITTSEPKYKQKWKKKKRQKFIYDSQQQNLQYKQMLKERQNLQRYFSRYIKQDAFKKKKLSDQL